MIYSEKDTELSPGQEFQVIFFGRAQELLTRMPSGNRRMSFKMALMEIQKFGPEHLLLRFDELAPLYGLPPIEMP